jgi:T4 RnlA family RNA ligase
MHQIYNDLMALQDNEAFCYVDQVAPDGFNYRIFLYRLASYSDFLLPGAIESRGITFRMNDSGEPEELVCRPMQKFFNLGENPLTIGLDSNDIIRVMDKRDGSLISTVYSPNGLLLKTKGSFHSEQVAAATKLLNSEKYSELRAFCEHCILVSLTVNMEYTSPNNRIVLGYSEPELTVLNVRSVIDGGYIPYTYIPEKFRVNHYDLDSVDCKHTFVESIRGMSGIEGFVLEYSHGLWVKVKTDEYCALHKTKDNINSPRKLFETCVLGAADDLIGMFKDDPIAVATIEKMQKMVYHEYNVIHKTVHAFYNENKHLDRKSYAIKGTSELAKSGLFGLAMNLYLGKEISIEDYMIKNYKQFGVQDDEV